MNDASVTVFRSAEYNAQQEAERVRDLLIEWGLDAAAVGPETEGVIVGTWEVWVPAAMATRAEELLARPPLEVSEPSASADLDLKTIFRSSSLSAEMEAGEIRNLLEASGIPAFIVGSQQLPVLPCEVRVPAIREAEALDVLRAAQEAGPEAAEQAEAASEGAG